MVQPGATKTSLFARNRKDKAPQWPALLKEYVKPHLLSVAHVNCHETLVQLCRHAHPGIVSASLCMLMNLFKVRVRGALEGNAFSLS